MIEVRRCSCGVELPAVTGRGRPRRYCSSWCKTRAARGLEPQRPPALVPPRSIPNTPAQPAPPAPPEPVPAPGERRAVPPPLPRRAGALVERVRRDLEAAGVLDTWEAAAALDVAASLELGGSGSARAALHRELRAIMADALRGTNDTSTSVGRYRDELEERRRRREERAGAGG